MDEPAVGAVGALVGVRAEEVALRLRQIERQVRPCGRCRSSRCEAEMAGHGDARLIAVVTTTRRQFGLRALNVGVELGVEQQVRQVWRGVVGLLDLVEELRADDAAALPDARASRRG